MGKKQTNIQVVVSDVDFWSDTGALINLGNYMITPTLTSFYGQCTKFHYLNLLIELETEYFVSEGTVLGTVSECVYLKARLMIKHW